MDKHIAIGLIRVLQESPQGRCFLLSCIGINTLSTCYPHNLCRTEGVRFIKFLREWANTLEGSLIDDY